MSKNKVLVVIWSETFDRITKRVVEILLATDDTFAAEMERRRIPTEDRSIAVRWALLAMTRHLDEVSISDWERYAALYAEHRATSELSQGHLRIYESGLEQINAIRNFINRRPAIGAIMGINNVGRALPSVQIVLTALAWELEQLGG